MNKFVNDHNDKPFHTNSYAEAANKGNMGATSSLSFEQRMRIEKNRKAIRQYRDSLIARVHENHRQHRLSTNAARPETKETPPANTRQAANAGEQNLGSTPDVGSTGSNRQAFREPSTRGYNPYS